MKVLMFSTDSSILKTGSPAQERMVEYGTLAVRLFIVVLSKKRVGSQISDISSNVRVYTLPFWSAWRIGKMFENEGINLVTAQDPFETGLIGYRAARYLRAKLQLQIHTDFLSPYFVRESLKNCIRVWIAKWLLPKADKIRVVSERIKNSLSKVNCQMSNVIVLPIFVDIQNIQSAPTTIDLHKKYPQFDFIALVASRWSKEKNITLAINAIAEVIKTDQKVGLIIVGDGSEKEKLILETQNSKLKTNIIFECCALGQKTEDLISYYKTTDVFLNTSNYEGYGRTLIEAAAAGCPIITTDVGVVGEKINKENSLVISVGNKEALVTSVLRLINDKNLRQELSQKAKAVLGFLDSKEVYLQKYKQSWQV